MLNELESGPWPSFITGLKKLANRTHNTMVRGVLDQLEYSYETKMGYWKGGVVGVRGYATPIPFLLKVRHDVGMIVESLNSPWRNLQGCKHARIPLRSISCTEDRFFFPMLCSQSGLQYI